jgi:branched-chain amino acid transport system ATP-binding protein
MLLELAELHVRYGRTHAVRGVTLNVHAGEIVTVLGANGAGKSSLLRAVAGLVPAAQGTIRFGGEDITRLPTPARVRNGLVLVPEGRQILVSLTVHENLLLGAHARATAEAAREAGAIYDRFPNLAARRDMPASVLSGGEQQMLAIGRAMLARPRLMMLDEPSLGLSPLLTQRLFGLIAELNREGLAIVLVEQNTRLALSVAGRGVVLELGRPAFAGTAAELADDAKLAAAYLGTE